MKICKLCQNEKKLSNSHIITEFLYSKIYNSNHKMIGVTGTGSKGYQKEQKGLREHLLCADCESFLNLNYEIPFRLSWYDSGLLPIFWNDPKEIKRIETEYSSFKLFHLCNLFRAGVSSLPTFSEVTLGPYEKKIREMLLSKDPGPDHEFPIYGYFTVHHKTNEVVHVVSRYVSSKYKGGRAYGVIYGGVQWWIGISKNIFDEISAATLKKTGLLYMHAMKMNEIGLFQDANFALNINKNKI